MTQNHKRRRSAVDGRTTRHAGHGRGGAQRGPQRIEEVSGWMKTVGGQRRKTRSCGTAKVG